MMTGQPPTLHMLCGKIASGKSTLAAELGRVEGTVILVEDDWLHALYADQLSSLPDYRRCTAKLRQAMGPHIISLLKAGLSVVLDFQANTVESRRWMRGLLDQTTASHALHFLDVSDADCLARLQRRNASGAHPFAVTEAQVQQFSQHFVAPTPAEGFHIVTHPGATDS